MPNSVWYWKYMKKDDRFYLQETKPKSGRIFYASEVIEKVGFQHQWHYLDGSNGLKCDFESVCGYDRGPGIQRLLRLMMNFERWV